MNDIFLEILNNLRENNITVVSTRKLNSLLQNDSTPEKLASLQAICEEYGIVILDENMFKKLNYDQIEEILNHKKLTIEELKKICSNKTDLGKIKKILIAEGLFQQKAKKKKKVDDDEMYTSEEDEIDEDALASEDFNDLFAAEEQTVADDNDNSDSMQYYFNLVGKYKLLTLKEEKELAERAAKGDEEACQKMMEANLRIVISIAKKYRNKGICLIDLIHDGNLGLYKAVQKFDVKKGFRFTTYAYWWIKQAITRSIAERSNMIRIPVHLFEFKNKINRFVNNYSWTHGKAPTTDVIARELDMPEDKIAYILSLKTNFLSLDQHVLQEDNQTLSEIMLDTKEEFPFEDLIKKDAFERMKKLIDALPEREAQIIKLRFGLDNASEEALQKNSTLDNIGNIIHVTRERIRQLESRAINRLKNLDNIKDIIPEYI